ncbi:hypothetical protein NDU88_005282 [Pleurodeles waltl]|uniref:Uncharacterized protein n=1 Tax=Pleurodeles waltl TaxID=8319 RepID=A0AAV7WY32_PLEWA|nr:hypothetical protein NDU88_005282 [Pleurodeles waltl]
MEIDWSLGLVALGPGRQVDPGVEAFFLCPVGVDSMAGVCRHLVGANTGRGPYLLHVPCKIAVAYSSDLELRSWVLQRGHLRSLGLQ